MALFTISIKEPYNIQYIYLIAQIYFKEPFLFPQRNI